MQASKSRFLLLLLALIFTLVITGCESAQRTAYNVKADAVGTDRTAFVYSPLDGSLLKTIRDGSLVIEIQESGAITLWLGDVNKKVFINGAIVIIEDN